MRISGGAARGIPLRAPKGVDLRPAMDRLRQGVFSSLGASVEGARFVDLFAGTGSYGLEALSRGAAGGVFVERHRATVAALRENLAAVCRSAGRSEEGVRIVQVDALKWTPVAHELADLIFVDPPFAEIPSIGACVLERCAGMLRAPASGLVVFEMPGEQELTAPGWRCANRIGQGRGQPTCCFYVRT